MYWPIAAPRIYAATKQGRDDEQQPASDDGTATPTQQKKSLENEGDRDSILLAEDEVDDEEAPLNGNREEEPSQQKSDVAAKKDTLRSNGTYSEEAEKDSGGQIVGIAVARTGHMFITITKSTLTVWQTKVSSGAGFRNRTKLIYEL